MSQKALKTLVRELNMMMQHTPLNTDDYKALLEELRKAKAALQSPKPNRAADRPQHPIPNTPHGQQQRRN